MLSVPSACDFQFSVDNFGATFSESGIGTGITTGGANAKGTDTEVLSDASVTEDCYGIAVGFSGGNSAANIRNFLVDIKTDPTGGTTWATIIPNLVVTSPSLLAGGYWYYFPLYIKAGTAIAASGQCNAATQALRVLVKLFGKPSRPEALKYGSVVNTFGAVTASSEGTSITPGTNAMGSYTASLGTTTRDLWWWQGGLAMADATRGAVSYLLDIAAGDATNKLLCQENILVFQNTTAEQNGKCCIGTRSPYRHMPSGSNVYARAACSGSPDQSITVVAYGLGG